jgi:hypothetical protein
LFSRAGEGESWIRARSTTAPDGAMARRLEEINQALLNVFRL